jgi:hypothetical protein
MAANYAKQDAGSKEEKWMLGFVGLLRLGLRTDGARR